MWLCAQHCDKKEETKQAFTPLCQYNETYTTEHENVC